MIQEYAPIWAAVLSCVCSAIAACVGLLNRSKDAAVKSQIDNLQTAFKYELSVAELRFYEKINDNYPRKSITDQLRSDLEQLQQRVAELEANR